MLLRKLTVVLLFTGFIGAAGAQELSNLRQRYVSTTTDSVTLDTLSLIPGSFFMLHDGRVVDSSAFSVMPSRAQLTWKNRDPAWPDSLLAVYRVFPVLFTRPAFRRSREIIEKKFGGVYNPKQYDRGEGGGVLDIRGLSKSGSISRGVRFGNSQDVVVNSSLNLQLAGTLSDDVEILAAITDNNIPVQPEGNTQQLNEFDKVFIRISKNRSSLVAGDFDLERPESYFMNFSKKGQGGLFRTAFDIGKGDTGRVMRVAASGAVSKGKYARNVFNGIEANQGPYKLRGADNETFIIILSGSEKVFIDGMQMARGQDYDYVIDYNTAEIIFTARRLITKDKRIVVEFQYSEKNFARSLVYANTEYEARKVRLKLNVYSEQDSKNQPLLQDLSDTQKRFLSEIGDDIQQAFFENIDSVAFNVDEILYQRIDSASFTFYRYSTDSAVAHYRLGFANTGPGNGNYVQVTTSANGRVYEWIPPVGGIPQGSYEPVTLLITPRQQQMASLGADFMVSERTTLSVEGAFSNYNVNLFSKADKGNDKGYALRTAMNHVFDLDTARRGWKIKTGLKFEHVNRYFKPIETYRPVEFSRDWNLSDSDTSDEQAASFLLGLHRGPAHRFDYELRSFQRGSRYRGFNNLLSGKTAFSGYRFEFSGSYLVTSGDLSKSQFIRGRADFSRLVAGRVRVGVRGDGERNRLYVPGTDSLIASGFYNHTGAVYLASADTSRVQFRADYARRTDYGIRYNEFRNATVADEATASVTWKPNERSRLAVTGTYRKLDITDTVLTTQRPDDNLLNRVEYSLTALKGAVMSNTFYEVGTGQELKREFSYVKVTDGTGIYAWNDYNNDGIPQLNEFETAAFKDEANYIRVFLPTDQFVKSRFSQFSQTLNLNPAALSAGETKAGKLLARFSNRFSIRLSNKTTKDDLLEALNPFGNRVDDSLLLATNSAFRNTLYFNRTSSKFGMDVTVEENRNKQLLTNGFESRVLRKGNTNMRWNITPSLTLNELAEAGEKTNTSDFFSSRDFLIRYHSTETRLHLQPGTVWRITLLYLYKLKQNELADAGERTLQHKGGIEGRYSSVKKGILSVAFNIIRNAYNADENSPIAYEMLEGLRAGTNFTWNVSLLRNLSGNVQLNLNYEGRKSGDNPPVHTGGVEVRAFF